MPRGPRSTAPANRSHHLFDPRLFTIDGGTGAKHMPLHCPAGARRRKRRAQRVGAGRSGAAAIGTASNGHMGGSHSAAPGKCGGGRKANAKGDAKNGRLFHAETPSYTRSTHASDLRSQSAATIKLKFIGASTPLNAPIRRRRPAAFAERCEEDRHQFRLIILPEDAADTTDLCSFTRGPRTPTARTSRS